MIPDLPLQQRFRTRKSSEWGLVAWFAGVLTAAGVMLVFVADQEIWAMLDEHAAGAFGVLLVVAGLFLGISSFAVHQCIRRQTAKEVGTIVPWLMDGVRQALPDEIARTIGNVLPEQLTKSIARAGADCLTVMDVRKLYSESVAFLVKHNPAHIEVVMPGHELGGASGELVSMNGAPDETPWLNALLDWARQPHTRLQRVICMNRDATAEQRRAVGEKLIRPMDGTSGVDQAIYFEELAVSVVTLGNTATFFGFPTSPRHEAWKNKGFQVAFAVEDSQVTERMRRWITARYWETNEKLKAMSDGKVIANWEEGFAR